MRYALSILSIILLGGCAQGGGIQFSGDIAGKFDRSCIEKALAQVPDITSVKHEIDTSKNKRKDTYIYESRGSVRDKYLEISQYIPNMPDDPKTWQGQSGPGTARVDHYVIFWSENGLPDVKTEWPIVYAVNDVVVGSCGLSEDFWKNSSWEWRSGGPLKESY